MTNIVSFAHNARFFNLNFSGCFPKYCKRLQGGRTDIFQIHNTALIELGNDRLYIFILLSLETNLTVTITSMQNNDNERVSALTVIIITKRYL